MPPSANADHASFGDSLFALLFTGMVFDVGLDGSTGKLQSELTLTARRKQPVHISRVSRSRSTKAEVSSVSRSPTSAELP